MSETFSKFQVIIGVARRHRFTTEQKLLGKRQAEAVHAAWFHGISASIWLLGQPLAMR